ncbi:MAG: KH domain-containing protein [Candidatus Margulisbacteria bacterium]|nr:KH domain-containing protein [Candidatus Margulisiibacteriota bacterium]
MGLFDIFKGSEEKTENNQISEDSGNTINDDMHNIAKDTLTEILDLMGFFNVVKILNFDTTFVSLEIKGDDLGRIIGKEGNTLYALQYLLKNILSKKYKRPVNVQLDANNYREKRTNSITNMALEAAQKAIAENREILMPAMNAWERRIVHTTLMENGKVKTESIGREQDRKVIVSPK